MNHSELTYWQHALQFHEQAMGCMVAKKFEEALVYFKKSLHSLLTCFDRVQLENSPQNSQFKNTLLAELEALRSRIQSKSILNFEKLPDKLNQDNGKTQIDFVWRLAHEYQMILNDFEHRFLKKYKKAKQAASDKKFNSLFYGFILLVLLVTGTFIFWNYYEFKQLAKPIPFNNTAELFWKNPQADYSQQRSEIIEFTTEEETQTIKFKLVPQVQANQIRFDPTRSAYPVKVWVSSISVFNSAGSLIIQWSKDEFHDWKKVNLAESQHEIFGIGYQSQNHDPIMISPKFSKQSISEVHVELMYWQQLGLRQWLIEVF